MNPKSPKASLKSAKDRVRAFLKVLKGGSDVLILISADPDSMASALAVRRLLWI
jgi:nanoRNase/pAp phosphatase (c-di-AMP/oligoRNAs hydrolase)